MTRIQFILIILISSLSLFLANGASKFQIGNDLFNNLVKVVSKKVIIEVNKHKDNLPPLNLDISPVKFIPITMSFTNAKFDEIVYREDEVQISVDETEKILKIKLSKN
jgi:hypothetical protein